MNKFVSFDATSEKTSYSKSNFSRVNPEDNKNYVRISAGNENVSQLVHRGKMYPKLHYNLPSSK